MNSSFVRSNASRLNGKIFRWSHLVEQLLELIPPLRKQCIELQQEFAFIGKLLGYLVGILAPYFRDKLRGRGEHRFGILPQIAALQLRQVPITGCREDDPQPDLQTVQFRNPPGQRFAHVPEMGD